jgi:hypothetical protein
MRLVDVHEYYLRIRKEIVVVSFQVLSRHMPAVTEEYHEDPEIGLPVMWCSFV